jgi:hypothetical protein
METIKREREQRLELDGVTYVINLANASPAFEMALSLGPLLKDLSVLLDKGGEVRELPIGAVLAQLGSPGFRELRHFLIEHVNVARDGAKPYRFSDRYDEHLDAYPSHYIPVLWKSFLFQFARFVRAGGIASSLFPEKIRAVFQNAA